MIFEHRLHIGWAHLDANRHLRPTAYLDFAADVRLMYFAEVGFSTVELGRHGLDPVIRSDQIDYFREIHLLEEVRVTLTVAGLSPDASRFRLRNEFFRGGTTLAARITSLGGWLSQDTRVLVAPPAPLAAALQRLSRSPDYADIASKP